MNSKLNEDYFKTREVHKKNSKGNTRYLYWIIFCVIFAFLFQYFFKNDSEKVPSERQEEISNLQEQFVDNKFNKDSVIAFKSGLYKIKILKNYSYSLLGKDDMLFISSNDSSEVSVIIQFLRKEVHIEGFINEFKEKVSTYEQKSKLIKKEYPNGNFLEIADVSYIKGSVNYYGTIFILRKEADYFIIQGTSNINYWNKRNEDIYEMIESFFIESNLREDS